jgi:hypothetical protein
MKLPAVPIREEYVRFWGGLDQVSPALTIPPGVAIQTKNYEPGIRGGFKRIDGYERYSGKTSPSAGTYQCCSVSLSGTVAVGDTITGVTSGATGVVVVVGSTTLSITAVTGAFTASESFQVSAVTVGAMTALPLDRGCPTALEDATALNAAADHYRALIAAPTGSGGIRGLALLKGTLYCFRDNAGATAGLIYKATGSGWSAITLYKTISFNTGTSSAIADGATISQAVSGATATVKRQVIESGTIAGGDAAGRLIITSVTGTFDATNVIQVGGVTKCTATSLATQIAISPGGRYETVNYNFTGSTDTLRVYGCDGVNKAFEFDGDVYIPINTGMATDTPLHISAHKQMLKLTFRGSVQSSVINAPFQWTAVLGATEIGMGDTISGMLPQAGGALIIANRNSAAQLTGASTSTFVLSDLSPGVGAIPYTMQDLGQAYWLDDRGVIQIARTEAFGNFQDATVSTGVQDAIDDLRQVAIASSVYRARNQYRIYGSAGTGLIMTRVQGKYGTEHHFSTFEYPVNVTCAVSGEDANGKDVVFFGASNGMVYQADKGSSFDGEAIEAYVRLAFNHSKTPSVIKQYRKAALEMTAERYSAIRMHPDFSYGTADISLHPTQTTAINGTGGTWDVSTWEAFYWDTQLVALPEIKVDGSGTNVSFVFYSNTDLDLGHVLQGLTTQFTPRRLAR